MTHLGNILPNTAQHWSSQVDPSDPTPPYEQLRRQVAQHIATGALAEGDRLPTVRQLARDLGLAAGTVARAYKELESAGLVETRRAAGTRVLARARPTARQVEAELASAAREYVARSRALGVDPLRAVQAVETALG